MRERNTHITDYRILTAEEAEDLSRKVEAAIHDGWQPHGTLCISPRGDDSAAAFAQAVVKFADRF